MIQNKITKGCPKCGCPAEKIVYKNCGPIIRIRCSNSKCGYGMTEGVEASLGRLVETWNNTVEEYPAILEKLYEAQGSGLAVQIQHEKDRIFTGMVTGVDCIKDCFGIELPGEFEYEGLDICKIRKLEKINREIPAIKEGHDIRIWLDDVRPAPEGYELVKSVCEAKALIEQIEAEGGTIEVLDLDHDLGDYAKYGGDGIKLLYYLIERETFYQVKLHTANPVGRANMQSMIDRYWP